MVQSEEWNEAEACGRRATTKGVWGWSSLVEGENSEKGTCEIKLELCSFMI